MTVAGKRQNEYPESKIGRPADVFVAEYHGLPPFPGVVGVSVLPAAKFKLKLKVHASGAGRVSGVRCFELNPTGTVCRW